MVTVNAKRYSLFFAAGSTLVFCIYWLNLDVMRNKYIGGGYVSNGESDMGENETFFLQVANNTTTKKTPVHYLCPVFSGGLGNTMFEYASTYGIAAAKGMEVIIGEDQDLFKVFKLQAHVRENMTECKQFKNRQSRQGCAYDNQLLNFDTNDNYNVMLYLQSWEYFIGVAADIRKQFVFRDSIQTRAENIIRALKLKYHQSAEHVVTLVGVHIRRGDIATQKNFLEYGYLVATSDYISHAMDYFSSGNYGNVVFVVCSNDMTWSKNTISKNYTVEFMEKYDRNTDLAILTLCDHTIMTVGTFGWWAAWLAGGEAIYYKHFVREDSGLRKEFGSNFSDYFWPGWIGMD